MAMARSGMDHAGELMFRPLAPSRGKKKGKVSYRSSPRAFSASWMKRERSGGE